MEPRRHTLLSIEEEATRRLRAVAAELSAVGLAISLHRTRAGLDLTATLHQPGRRETDVLIDEDGYTELRYWADPAATPAQLADTIVHALSVVSAIQARETRAGRTHTALHAEAISPLRSPDRAMRTITGYDGAVTERAGDGGMTGSQDRLAERQTSPDSVRPHEPDKVQAELQERMERLPHGHPSSPYNADGTRKPPVPDLTSSEYPIPGDPDFHPDTPNSLKTDHAPPTPDSPAKDETPGSDAEPDQELPAEDKPQIGPGGSWEWKDCRLTPEESLCGDQGVASCREAEGRDADGRYAEHGLTPAMRRIEARLDHGKLAPETEKYALKDIDRFKEKLWEMITAEPDKPPAELVKEIHDGIRYTFILDPGDYADGVREISNRLEVNGYELGVRKNTWGNDEYKGVNTRWLDPSSRLRFEVQFHTEQSWTVKQRTHDAYTKIHDIRTPTEERERLRDYQREISSQVLSPPRWEEIVDFRKEGW